MTAPHPQQYIITEKHFCEFEGTINLLRLMDYPKSADILEKMISEIRSSHDIATNEREEVLDKILNYILNDMCVEIYENGKKHLAISGTFSIVKLINYIQSLRTRTQEQDGEQ
ncbi:MAG: hypothetical protein EHJ95_06170 [Methanobacteriota archaeon]|nr:MAG: hypothetical protein EHJ95_06170 [Euryarchaeota archaeon]